MALTFDDDQATALLEAIGLSADTTDLVTIQATVEDMAKSSGGDAVAAAKRAGLATIDPGEPRTTPRRRSTRPGDRSRRSEG